MALKTLVAQHNQSLQPTRGICHEPCCGKSRASCVRASEPRRYVAALLSGLFLSASGVASDERCETRYSESESEGTIKIISSDSLDDGDIVIAYPTLSAESRATVAIGLEYTYEGLEPFYTTVAGSIECHDTCLTPVFYSRIPEYLSLRVLVILTVHGECNERYQASRVVGSIEP